MTKLTQQRPRRKANGSRAAATTTNKQTNKKWHTTIKMALKINANVDITALIQENLKTVISPSLFVYLFSHFVGLLSNENVYIYIYIRVFLVITNVCYHVLSTRARSLARSIHLSLHPLPSLHSRILNYSLFSVLSSLYLPLFV